MPNTRCAVVIGVERIRGLATLQSAVSGAQRFADWATSQNIDVTLLVDSTAEVTLAAVKAAVKAYVERRTYTQLVLFFSGHGILPAPESEVWLLSRAPEDPDEAISVSGSVRLARNVGIPHVVVISDACRSRPDTARMSEVTGRNIFPNEPPLPRTRRPEVDLFYATLPGDPAYEVASDKAIAGYRSIFTDCALQGLKGEVPELIKQIPGPTAVRHVVTPRGLKSYLESEVPSAIASVHIALQQFPDIRVESGEHSVLSELAQRAAHLGHPTNLRSVQPLRDVMRRTFEIVTFLKNRELQNAPESAFRDIPNSTRTAMMAQERHDALESAFHYIASATRTNITRLDAMDGTGFVVVGGDLADARVDGLPCDFERRSGQIRVHSPAPDSPPRAHSILIEFADGTGAVLAVLPHHIGAVVVEDGRIATVNYTPSQSSNRYWEYRDKIGELELRRAHAAVASRNGVFDFPPDKAAEFAGFFRVLKGIDPTLGLYAAYAYARAGRVDEVHDIYDYMQREAEPVLFDVAMLAHPLPAGVRLSPYGVAPFCPMLAQGWALLGDMVDDLPAPVREARRHLVPGLWTMFTAQGVELLRPLMQR